MEVNKISNQSFGMAIKYRPDYDTVRSFIHRNYSQSINDKVGIMTKLQERNPVDIYLSIADKNGQKVYTTDVVVESTEFVESKNSAQKASAEPAADMDEGFMSIPDGVNDEGLPFN